MKNYLVVYRKRIGAICMALMCGYCMYAQEAADSITLDEVVVESARTIKRDDGIRFFPEQNQKDASTSGYSLLSKLALPGIKVDEIANTISPINSMKGDVQVRINDIIATQADLMSLDLQSIKFIDFIENPGIRYGKDVANVINIKTNKPISGYMLGTSMMNLLTTIHGRENAFAKMNRGKSEFAIDYSFGYDNQRRTRYTENTNYILADNSLETVLRRDTKRQERSQNHNIQMTYNVSDFDRYVFQAKLNSNISRTPLWHTERDILTNNALNKVVIDETSKSFSPSLDLYYNLKIDNRQNFTANAVGTYSKDRTDYLYGDRTPYEYDGKVNVYSLISEAIYENQLKPFMLSLGMQYSQKYVNTEYFGNVNSNTGIRKSDVYLFSQITGRLSAFSYTLGLGATKEYSRQGTSKYNLLLFQPKLSLSYSLTDNISARYNFTMNRRAPRLNYINDIAVRMNEREVQVGNPELTPTKVVEHILDLSYQSPRLYSSLSAFYRGNSNCVLPHIDRIVDEMGESCYIFTRRNQEECNMFYIMNYTKYNVIPRKLEVSAQAGIYRFFNYGGTYKHHYTSVDMGIRTTAYLGRFTLSAAAQKGFSFLEGESKGCNGDTYFATASYKWKNFDFALYWQHELPYNGELLNKYVQKKQHLHKGDNMNMIGLNIAYRLSKGRRYTNADRKINNMENDKNAFIKASN